MSRRLGTKSQPTKSALGVPTTIDDSNTASAFPAGENTSMLQTITPTIPSRAIAKGEKEYRNTKYGFALYYSDTLLVHEYDEGNGAMTVMLEDAAKTHGFDIFVVPYIQRQVNVARFKKDEPSGVMKDPTQIIIAHNPATMFFGYNDVMGDTREVWFIHGGYLFEVATYKAQDAKLSQVMSSWYFLK